MATIASLAVNLIAQTNRFTQPLRSAERTVKTFNSAIEKTTDRLKKVDDATSKARTRLLALKAAVAVATNQATQYAGAVIAVHEQTGLAVESVQALRFAAEESSTDIKTLEMGLRSLVRRAAEARQGNQSFAKGFDRLGVSVTRADGSLKDTETLLMEVADGARRMATEAEASAALMLVMGDAGRRLVPFMRQGSAGIQSLMDQAVALGIVLDERAVRSLDALGSEISITGNRIGAMSRDLVYRASPAISVLFGWINRLIDGFFELSEEQRQNIVRWTAYIGMILGAVAAIGVFTRVLVAGMGIMRVFATVVGIAFSPLILNTLAVIAVAALLRKAWEADLGGIQSKTETVTANVRQAWERLARWFSGEPDLFEAPSIGPPMRWEPGRRSAFSLPSLPAPDWDTTINAAAESAKAAWENARTAIGSLAPITLPAVEWPGWPTIDTEPLVAEWEKVKTTVDALETPTFPTLSVPEIDTSGFQTSWDRFANDISKLQVPPIPEEVETWVDRVADAFRRSPSGQLVVNLGELADEVMAGEKQLHDALIEILKSNLSIPFTAAIWMLAPISAGWKLTLTGVMLALNFLPDVDLSGSGINKSIGNLAEQISEALRKEDLVTIGEETFSASEISQTVGRSLGEALGEAVLFAFDLVAAILGIPGLDSRAYELGKTIGQEIIVPFAKGLSEGFSEAIRRAWIEAMERETEERLFRLGFYPERRSEAARELAEQLEGREFFFEPAPKPSAWERFRRWLDDIRGFQDGTPWTGYGPLDEVAGVVHRQEAVIPAKVLKSGPGAILEFLGFPGFQDGRVPSAMLVPPSVRGNLPGLLESLRPTLSEHAEYLIPYLDLVIKGLDNLSNSLEFAEGLWDELNEALIQGPKAVDDAINSVRDFEAEMERSERQQQALNTLTAQLLARMPVLNQVLQGMQAGAAFGPMGAVAGAFAALALQSDTVATGFSMINEILGALANAVGMLLRPLLPLIHVLQAVLVPIFTVLGTVLEAMLLPIMPFVFEGLKWLGVVVLLVGEAFQRVRAMILDAVGGLIVGIARFINSIPFLSANNMLRAGEAMQKSAQAARDSADEMNQARRDLINLTYEEAMARARNTEELEKATSALINIPSGFKYALARVEASTARPAPASVSPSPAAVVHPRSAPGAYGLSGGGAGINVTIQGDVYGWDDFRRKVEQANAESKRSGGLSSFGFGGATT